MHEGHRKRLYQKIDEGANLYEHEILEILLFNVYPRIDTNPIAHRLLDKFRTLPAVLAATPDELKMVEGVGEQAAFYLATVGKCMDCMNKTSSFAVIANYAEMREFAYARLKGSDEERVELYLLNKRGKLKRILTYPQKNDGTVVVESEELGKAISIYHPYALFVAHNHLWDRAKPTAADDAFTKQCQLVCSMFNVSFYDHLIFDTTGDYYSYSCMERIGGIRKDFTMSAVLERDEKKEAQQGH